MEELYWESMDETVRKIEPFGDAAEVVFNWTTAQRLLDDIDALERQLGIEQMVRVGMTAEDYGGMLGEWSGPFRTEFDTVYDHYMALAAWYQASIRNLGHTVMDNARAVNAEQIRRNGEEPGYVPPAVAVTGDPGFCG